MEPLGVTCCTSEELTSLVFGSDEPGASQKLRQSHSVTGHLDFSHSTTSKDMADRPSRTVRPRSRLQHELVEFG
jgi:hypothetical protein